MDDQTILQRIRNGIQKDASLLTGCMDIYRATGNPLYREEALRFLASAVSPEGEMAVPDQDALSYGRALFFAWDETGEERFKAAAVRLASGLKAGTLPENPRQIGNALPFLAECDTRFGDKQAYRTVANHAKMLREKHFDPEKKLYFFKDSEEKALENEALLLSALADTAEKLDEQLYEHYRAVADLFLEAVKGLLSHQTGPSALFSSHIAEPEETLSFKDNLTVCRALLKGVRLGILDEEKYLPIARAMMAELQSACASQMPDPDFPAPLGLQLMAEAEFKGVQKQ